MCECVCIVFFYWEETNANLATTANNKTHHHHLPTKTHPHTRTHALKRRSVEADDKMLIAPPTRMTLEEAIGFVAADELIEVTPDRVRIRKVVLDSNARLRAAKRAAAADVAATA